MALPAAAPEVPAAPRRAAYVHGPEAAASVVALAAWWVAFAAGAHLWHYDARAHLVVARRVLDSLTPGWIQLGAVWLPVPHLLNVLPAKVDALYRTGLFASLLGVAAFLVGAWALAAAAREATRDRMAGVVVIAIVVLNPGWLYLQATPLTEPLFLALAGGLALGVVRWRARGRVSGLALATVSAFLACLTRYEAWPMTALAVVVAFWGAPGDRRRARRAALGMAGLGLLLPVVLFALHSWISTERPFYVMDEQFLTAVPADPRRAMEMLADGITAAFGLPLCAVAAAAVLRLLRRPHLALGLAVAFAAPAAVTLTAYLSGHPAKARYPLLLAPALALAVAGATAGRRALQLAVLAVAASQSAAVADPPPVLVESARGRFADEAVRPALTIFRGAYRGGRVLASMGSAAPLLFDLGLPLREIVHEGNGNFWTYAAVDPPRYVKWVLIGRGDTLDQVRTYRPRFPQGFVPVARWEQFVVYRRVDDPPPGPPPLGPPPSAAGR